MNRRSFARLLAGSSAAVLLDRKPTFASPGVGLDAGLSQKFPLEPGLTFMNAANLCPSSLPVIESLQRWTTALDRDPSQATKTKLAQAKEDTRAALAKMLRATPEEIVVTRNTSEANNLVSSGLGLKAGDEVVIFADNHPSNHAAWREKEHVRASSSTSCRRPVPIPALTTMSKRFEEDNTEDEGVGIHARDNTVGDVLPAKDLCRAARA